MYFYLIVKACGFYQLTINSQYGKTGEKLGYLRPKK